MKVKNESEVAQSGPTLSDPMDCSPPGSSVHGDFPGKSTGVGCHCFLQPQSLTQMSKNIQQIEMTVSLVGRRPLSSVLGITMFPDPYLKEQEFIYIPSIVKCTPTL